MSYNPMGFHGLFQEYIFFLPYLYTIVTNILDLKCLKMLKRIVVTDAGNLATRSQIFLGGSAQTYSFPCPQRCEIRRPRWPSHLPAGHLHNCALKLRGAAITTSASHLQAAVVEQLPVNLSGSRQRLRTTSLTIPPRTLMPPRSAWGLSRQHTVRSKTCFVTIKEIIRKISSIYT
jgi:hypothetical protein